MARLNIEDQFFLEINAVASVKNVSPDLLAGNAIRFFRYSQELFKAGKTVSIGEFSEFGFMSELIPVFAKQTEAGLSCSGAGKHFSWLLEKSEAGALGGKKSAENRRNKFGTAQPISKNDRSKSEATPKQARSSEPSPSPSSSIKKKIYKKKEGIEVEMEQAFARYPLGIRGAALKRYLDQIKNPQDYQDLVTSIDNYNAFLALPENKFRSPKQSWATYLGTETTSFFWRDFIVMPTSAKPKKPDFVEE